jgi:hypothetical protein
MALAVCLLLDQRTERTVRLLWERLEQAGLPSMPSHTHGRHVPHVSYAVVRQWDLAQVRPVVESLPDGGPVELRFDALGTFRRGRAWLGPAVTTDLVRRQERLMRALSAERLDLHRNYLPGWWVPHCTLAPRVRLQALPELAAIVYEVLPLVGRADRAALVDSSTGRVWPLPNVP